MYSSDRNVKEAEQVILQKKVSKTRLTQEDERLKFTSLQDAQDHERTTGHQYSTNGAVETETVASSFMANEISEETVDAEGNVTVSGEVKMVLCGFSLLPKCHCGLVCHFQQGLQLFHQQCQD